MAITKVRDLSAGSSKSSAASIATAVMPATVPIGDTVMVAYAGSTTTSAVSSVTDTKGNTYTVLADVAGTSSRIAIAASVLTVALTTSDTITVNLAVASGIRCVTSTEFSGLTITQDVTAKSAAGTSTTPSTGVSAATSTANTLTFAAIAESNATTAVTFTPGTGYTADLTATTGTTGTNRSLQTEHRINSSTGTQTADATIPSLPWDALEVVLQELAASVLTDSGTSTSVLAQSSAEAGAEGATSTVGATQSGIESAGDAGALTLTITQTGVESGGGGTPPTPVFGTGGGGSLATYYPQASKRLKALIREQERKRQRLMELERQTAEARHRQGARRRGEEMTRLVERIATLDAQIARAEAAREAQAVIAQQAQMRQGQAARTAQRHRDLRVPLAEPVKPLELPAELTLPRQGAVPPLYVPAEWQEEEELMALLGYR